MKIDFLRCNSCGKCVSSGFISVPNEISDDIVIRAWIECPECLRKDYDNSDTSPSEGGGEGTTEGRPGNGESEDT